MSTRVPAADSRHPYRSRRSINVLTAVLLAALASAGTGCTTTQNLYPPAAAPENALAGVQVTVLTNDGRSIEIEVVESSAEYLRGTDSSGQSHVFRLQDIQSLQVTRFSAGKTALLTVGIAAGIAALAALAAYPAPGI